MLFTVHYLGDYRERGMGQGDGRGRWERRMGEGELGEGDYEKVMGEGDYEKRTAEGQNLIPIKLLIGLVMHFFNKIFLIGNEIKLFQNLPWSSWYAVS